MLSLKHCTIFWQRLTRSSVHCTAFLPPSQKLLHTSLQTTATSLPISVTTAATIRHKLYEKKYSFVALRSAQVTRHLLPSLDRSTASVADSIGLFPQTFRSRLHDRHGLSADAKPDRSAAVVIFEASLLGPRKRKFSLTDIISELCDCVAECEIVKIAQM